jgi:glycosyltransferase 2 family protein
MSESRWRLVKRALTLAFFGIVLALLVSQAREIQWSDVRRSIAGYGAQVLALAVALAFASHLLYGLFDQIGKTYTGHALGRVRVAMIAFVSYAFNLNMGSLIGGLGFRYRLYSRYGLDNGTIARVTGLSIAGNWLGYLAVAGTAFSFRMVAVPPGWEIGTGGLQWVGFVMVGFAIVYLAACAWSPRRNWTVRGHELVLPSFRMAGLQFAVASLNWMLIAALIYLLLDGRVAYPTVVAVMSISAIAGVITHIPAGLGVIEVVFFTLLGHVLPRSELLAALLAYRAVYYLLPLGLALGLFLKLEADAREGEGSLVRQGKAADTDAVRP